MKQMQGIRIFHGPRNIGGLGGYLAESQRKAGAISDFVVLWQDQTHRKNHHIRLDLGNRKRILRGCLRMLYFLFAAAQYDVFHFYGEETLLPRNFDLPILKLLGKKVLVTYCGSDVRQASILAKLNPYFELVTTNPQDRPEQDARKLRSLRRQSRWADRIIISRNAYYSVKEYVPSDKLVKDLWIHTSIDLDAVSKARRAVDGKVVVVHAPSHPGIKGTEYIKQAIEELRKRGFDIDFRCIRNTPHEEVMRVLSEEADIVVDQVLYGGFGVFSVEAMAHRLPVCCYLIERAKKELYPDVPIVCVTIETLAEQLAWLIENPREREVLGEKGFEFVRKHCDRRMVTEKLWQLYEDVLGASIPRKGVHYGQRRNFESDRDYDDKESQESSP